MHSPRVDRLLPRRYSRIFLAAAENEVGAYSLEMLVRAAKLESLTQKFAARKISSQLAASELAALLNTMRTYYGSGARGSLNRVGRSVWHAAIAETPRGRMTRLIIRRMPPFARSRFALGILARLMRKPAGNVSVHLLDTNILLMDTTSNATYNQQADQVVCWYSIGLIQATLYWALEEEKIVEEIACRATGAEACKFHIQL